MFSESVIVAHALIVKIVIFVVAVVVILANSASGAALPVVKKMAAVASFALHHGVAGLIHATSHVNSSSLFAELLRESSKKSNSVVLIHAVPAADAAKSSIVWAAAKMDVANVKT